MKALKDLGIFVIMGLIYICIELMWRGYTHWSMFFVGGAAGLACGLINQYHLTWEMGILKQGLYGTGAILALEFVSGCILNLWLKWDVWDYSNMPLNILGQICLPFAFAWFALAIVAIVLDDYLRFWLYGEEKPHYHILDHTKC